MQLVKNLYAYVWQGNDNNCNSYVFANVLPDNKHMIIDPGHIVTPFYREPALEMLGKEMEKDGLDIRDIGMVTLTHSHSDHCEAARQIKEWNDAQIAIHSEEAGIYTRAGGQVDISLEEGTLLLGQQESLDLEINHSPGHSPGHITVYWPEQKVLIAGDVIFYRSTGRVDLPGGSVLSLKQSIEKLAELDLEYVLCGHPYGHPGIIEGAPEIKQNFDFIRRYILP